jgi:hypothetical protein
MDVQKVFGLSYFFHGLVCYIYNNYKNYIDLNGDADTYDDDYYDDSISDDDDDNNSLLTCCCEESQSRMIYDEKMCHVTTRMHNSSICLYTYVYFYTYYFMHMLMSAIPYRL